LPKFDCNQADSLQFDEDNMKGYCVPPEVAESVENAMRAMTPANKASQMLGVPVGNKNYRDIERSPDTFVQGFGEVRGYRYRDAGRGVNMDAGQDNRRDDKKNYATAFPSPSLRAASWDLDLERRIGAAIGDETAASRNNMNLGPCMNIVRHPYWGRTQETYGEDMYGIGRMATAYTVGVQEYVVACAKHYAANNVEKFRSKQNAVMTEQTLREIYGRHFEMVVQDGSVGCIMAAYNLINGVKATQSAHLLRNTLKNPVEQGGMGYPGLVITDWWAMPGDQETNIDASTAQAVTNEAVIAGTDIEVPWQIHYSEATLANADQNLVDDAARRILTQKFLFHSAMADQPWSKKKPKSRLNVGEYDGSIEPLPEHEDLAEETVVKSAVLLANGLGGTPVLPIREPKNIAVIGMQQYFEQISSSVPSWNGPCFG
jgi:beta-glucosidase